MAIKLFSDFHNTQSSSIELHPAEGNAGDDFVMAAEHFYSMLFHPHSLGTHKYHCLEMSLQVSRFIKVFVLILR